MNLVRNTLLPLDGIESVISNTKQMSCTILPQRCRDVGTGKMQRAIVKMAKKASFQTQAPGSQHRPEQRRKA